MKHFFELNNKTHLAILFLIIAFILYGNTLGNKYTLNDAIVITENEFTQQGFTGIWKHLSNDSYAGFLGVQKEAITTEKYKPLSLVAFSIEQAIFGNSPFIGHLFNILWYALNAFLLFICLQRLLPQNSNEKAWQNLALWTTIFWLFHPIHTEVVANIKGRDEIMAFSGVLASLYFFLNYVDRKKIKDLILSSIFFFLALLSKESAIIALILFPLVLYIYKPKQLKSSIPVLGSLLLFAIIWYNIRSAIINSKTDIIVESLVNNPFLNASSSEKYATIFYTLGEYFQLHLFPHPLTFDYSFGHIPIVNWDDSMVLFSLFIFLILISLAIWGLIKKNTIGFGLTFFILSLFSISNLFFPMGVFMSESFSYLSSLGFSLVLAYSLLYGIPQLTKSNQNARKIIIALSSVILLLYSGKTISRNFDWKDNRTIVMKDVATSTYGIKSNMMAGGFLLTDATKEDNVSRSFQTTQKGISYLELALEVYPKYTDALLLMGNAKWQLRTKPEEALYYYQKILEYDLYNEGAWQNIFFIIENSTGTNYKLDIYKSLLDYNVYTAEIYLGMGRVFGQEIENYVEAEKAFKKGLEYDPNSFDLLANLGTAYGIQGKYIEAIEVLEKALTINSTEVKTYIELGLSYYEIGELNKAKELFDEVVRISPEFNRADFPI